MYREYWRLDRKPFENTSDAGFYYPSESHQGALLKLRYAVENQRGGALLAAATGLGKTLLVQLLRRQLADVYRPFVHVVFPRMPTHELLNYLADELGAPRSAQTTPTTETGVRRVEHALAANTAEGRHAVIVIDEAHLVDDARTLEAVRLLLNFETASRPSLTLLLVGQPKLLPVLDRMAALEERMGVKCLLSVLSEDETASYVQHRLQAAGAKRSIFEADALEAVHELTGGVPRRINRLCDLALLIGFAEERSTLGGAQIAAVHEELVTVAAE